MKRALLLLMVLVALPARADLMGEWHRARAIAVPPLTVPQPVYLPLNAETLAAVEGLSEYRVVRASRIETPYRMVEERGQTETYPLDVKTVAQSPPGIVPEEIMLNLGDRPASRLRLTLELIGSDFRCRASVEGSRDKKQWEGIAGNARLWRQAGGVEQHDLVLPFRDDRWLRLRLFREQGSLPRITRVQVLSEVVIARRLVPVSAALVRTENRQAHLTVLILDTGRRTRDLAETHFEITETAFDRPVTVETLGEGNVWEYAATGALRRLAEGGTVALPLELPQTRKLRFSISNGDDAPLTIRTVTLWRVRRGLIFIAEPGQPYELWFGRPGAATPAYEMERLPLTRPPTELPLGCVKI